MISKLLSINVNIDGMHYVTDVIIHGVDVYRIFNWNQTRLKQFITSSHVTAAEMANDIDKPVIDAVPFGGGGGVVGPVKRI